MLYCLSDRVPRTKANPLSRLIDGHARESCLKQTDIQRSTEIRSGIYQSAVKIEKVGIVTAQHAVHVSAISSRMALIVAA